jgi:opacity protein-like surface antigen
MNTNSCRLILSAIFLSGNTLAGTMGSAVLQQSDLTWLATLSAGSIWESAGTTQNLYLTPEIEKAYVANQSTRAVFDGEVVLGLQKRLSQTVHAQLGLAVGVASNAILSGVVWDDADPEFDNYTYRYSIQHTHVAVKGKLLKDISFYGVTPYITGSLGVGFNRAYNFTNTPRLFEAVAFPDFTANTRATFTYTAGAGVQRALNEHWQVGMGYEFADWGSSQLGRAEGQNLNEGLSLNHLYTNGLLLSLTWIA